MELQHNSRQIPSNKKYTANKKYSDLVYGYLQQKSKLDEVSGIRFLEKREIKYTQMAEDLGLSRQTASRRVNDLISEDLLYYDEDTKRYVLRRLEAELAALLPCDTVRVLCVNLQERSLSTLAYLIKSYFQHNQEPYEINLDILKAQVGLSADNRGRNNQVVKDILVLLERLGFVEYHVERDFNAETGGFKTKYIIDKVDNEVNFSKESSEVVKKVHN